MRITLLGTGASSGVPLIGCQCQTCLSPNPRNVRKRSSVLIDDGTTTILVDTSPDLREQALQNHITHIDAILYTHAHADHTHGIDEVRSFNYLANKPVDIYAEKETLGALKGSFPYAFLPAISDYGWFRPCLIPHEIAPYMPFQVGTITVQPFAQQHGKIISLGFRFGSIAYSTDVNLLSAEAFDVLQGTSIWVVDCLRRSFSPTHANLGLTLEWVRRVAPKQAILTHMSHDFDYDILRSELPIGVVPGYDGMVITG